MATARSVPPPITITSSKEVITRDDPHKLRRRFIGPMPERVISQLDDLAASPRARSVFGFFRRGRDGEDEDAGVRGAIREHALQFFLGHGGREEDWDESQERNVREEMYNKWKQSEWGQARTRRREAKRSAGRWMGTSFDVGVFLGVDIINRPISTRNATNATASTTTSRVQTVGVSTAAETYVTAPSGPSGGLPDASSSEHNISQHSADSITPLIQVSNQLAESETVKEVRSNGTQQPSDTINPPIPSLSGTQNNSFLRVPNARRGKRKNVHYSDEPMATPGPAPPEEVLARSGSEVEDTSAGAAQQAVELATVPDTKDDVIMRDRMMVQISFTPAENCGLNFDETKNRVTQHLQYEDWSEYMVVWRKNRIELYNNFFLPGREWYAGHKHLAFVIPLTQTTKLSLYSFTDLSFTLTCSSSAFRARSRTKTRLLLYGSREGTNIFIFNTKSRTRAVDWLWRLWQRLGGEVPLSIEVRCPTLDTHLKIDIPQGHTGDQSAFNVFTPSNTVGLCKDVLRKVADYDEVIGGEINHGASLQLAWRMDTRLDWVWQPEDLLGNRRGWAVLYGLALKQGGKQAHLELRLQEHRSTRIRLKDGTRLDEPPGIEGYLDRIKPNSQLKQALYLATHDGYLFSVSPTHANPPPPPGPPEENVQAGDLRHAEARRGASHILQASRMCDLRNIVAVRRASQLVPRYTEEIVQGTPDWEDIDGFWENTESFDEDHRDIGGDEGLAKLGRITDKSQLRLRRSLELVFKNGRVVRFEAYSCHHALEWIARLRPLISYWRKRHQVDARMEMDIVYAGTGRPRVTPRTHLEQGRESPPDAPPDPAKSSPDLSAYYNWCLLEGCRPISKCGKAFGKKGLRGQYKHMQLILVQGHLVEYHISAPSLHHRRGRVIHLVDAYIFSGYLAALRLPEGQYKPDAPPLPRRYQDGLESDDLEEDTLFMVWWYTGGANQKAVPDNTLPGLAAKRKVSVYRTRSKLERDAWVWAIKADIEKTLRADKDRELRLRETGGLVRK